MLVRIGLFALAVLGSVILASCDTSEPEVAVTRVAEVTQVSKQPQSDPPTVAPTPTRANLPEPTATATLAPTATATARPAPAPSMTPTAAAESSPTAPSQTAATPSSDRELVGIDVELVFEGFEQPVQITNAGDGSNRLFVVSRLGTIRVIDAATTLASPFLDVGDLIRTGGSEQGLLGLAFHPAYRENGRFFVNYTNGQGNTVIAEYGASPGDPNRARPEAVRVVLTYEQPFRNHNGGMLAFGPDGYLYIGAGDGGSGGDPQGNGQRLSTLLGKMLRIDVDSGDPYSIPSDNPFVNDASARPEIWAYGLRNPWRYSFDRETGDLYIADVGQNRIEEVSFQPASSSGGENYGWNVTEGSTCFSPSTGCDDSGFVLPVAEYDHRDGCSITGDTSTGASPNLRSPDRTFSPISAADAYGPPSGRTQERGLPSSV